VWLGEGKDRAVIARNVVTPIVLDGGPGNDRLTALGGPAVLLGGPGRDLLYGSRGRDVLIGGEGADWLLGSGGDDLLIGGTTVFDDNDDALLAILEEWNSDRSYDDRIANLRSGAGPSLEGTGVKLEKGLTVFDDGERDYLRGYGGQDWFLFDPLEDRVRDLKTYERAN
jgi:Ca2+-binding RTX toxin-like protein